MSRALVTSMIALASLLAGCATLAPPEEPRASDADARDGPTNLFLLGAPRPFGTDVSGGAEPMVLAARDGTLYIGDTGGFHRSTDGGATWTHPRRPGFLGGLFTDGWALAEDDMGTLYIAVTNGQMISVAASRDHGDTWEHVNHVADVSGVADRPWIAARGDGEVAVVFYDAGKTTREACLHSTDGGRTFLTRFVDANVYPNAGNLAFGPDGSLYYATGVMTYRWATPCKGTLQRMSHADHGVQIFTQVAVDGLGRTHVAEPTVDHEGILLSGTVGVSGKTTRRMTISPPELRSNTFAAVSATTDEIVVAWYGSETPGVTSDPAFAGAWNVYVARVTGFWTDAPSVAYERLTTQPNHVGNFCMQGIGCSTGEGGDRDLLDYFGVDQGPDGSVHVAYGHDGAGSNADVRYARLSPP